MSLKSSSSAPGRAVLTVGVCLLVNAMIHPSVLNAATAQPTTTPAPLDVALRYAATAPCPEREVFLELVHLRAPHVRLVEPGPPATPDLEVVVVLSERPEGSAGEARISREGKLRDQRTFRGSDCLEVARAAALSVAFVLETQTAESDGSTLAEPRPSDSGAPRPDPPPSEPAATPAPSGPPVAGTSPTRASRAAHAVTYAVGIAPLAVRLLNEPWLVGGELWLGVRQAHGLGASARLGLLVADSGTLDPSTAKYRWIAAEARLCPFRLGETWTVSTCAQGVVGALRAEGVAVEFPLDVSVSWVAIGASLQSSVSLAASTRLVANLSANAPLSQRTFVFERPRRVVTRSETVGWLVSVGVEHDIGGG